MNNKNKLEKSIDNIWTRIDYKLVSKRLEQVTKKAAITLLKHNPIKVLSQTDSEKIPRR